MTQAAMQRSGIAEKGYAQGTGIFMPDEIAGMQEAITETIDRIARGFRTPFETSCPEEPFERRLDACAQGDRAYAIALMYAVLADAQRDPRIAGVAEHPRLIEEAAGLVAPHRIVASTVRVRLNVPTLVEIRSHWHQDVVHPGGPPGSCGTVRVACWIPLVDATEQNGTLEVIPGSHPGPYPHTQDGAGRFHLVETSLPETPARAVPCPAGDVLFLDRFMPHRSLPNRTDTVRWNIVAWLKCDG